MSLIAAIQDGDRIIAAGDSFVGSGYEKHVQTSPKVFRKGEYLLGSAGTARISQIIRAALEPSPCGENVLAHLATVFSKELRDCLREHGALSVKDGVEQMPDNFLLIAVRGKLVTMGQAFGITETDEGFAAVGSGKEYALGALHALTTISMDAREKLRIACEAARFDPGVSPPFTFVE